MRQTAVYWLILAVGALLRVIDLGGQSLWWDEAWQYYVVDAAGFPEFWERLLNPKITLNPPLYHLVSYAGVRLLSGGGEISDAVLRAPSVILGILNLPLLHALVRRLFPGDRSLALGAMAVMALAPFHVHYSQEARMYTLLMAFALLATLALLRALERGGWTGWALYALCAAGAMYTHVHSLFGLLGHALWVVLCHRRNLRAFVLSALAGAVLFLPIVAFFVERVGNLRSPYGGAGATLFSIPYALFVYSVGLSIGPGVTELKAVRTLDALAGDAPVVGSVGILFGALLVAGLAAARRRGGAETWLLALGLGAPILGVSAAALVPDMTFNVRYTSFGFPFFCVLLALGLGAAWRRSRALGIVAIAGVLVAFGVSNVARHTSARYAKEDVRDAVASWRAAPGPSLLFSYAGSPTVERYASAEEERWHVPIYARGAVERRMTSILGEVAVEGTIHSGAADSVYVLLARDWQGVVERQVRDAFDVVEKEELPGAVSLLTVRVPLRVGGPPADNGAPTQPAGD